VDDASASAAERERHVIERELTEPTPRDVRAPLSMAIFRAAGIVGVPALFLGVLRLREGLREAIAFLAVGFSLTLLSAVSTIVWVRRGRSAMRLLREGVPCVGIVERTEDPGPGAGLAVVNLLATASGQGRGGIPTPLLVTARVSLPDGRWTRDTWKVHPLFAGPWVAPGSTVTVLVDPDDPTHRSPYPVIKAWGR
jgi:hypothetical protein